MKRILIKNPGTKLIENLVSLGIVDDTKKVPIYKRAKEGFSKNAIFGNYNDFKLFEKDVQKYTNKYFDKGWKSFTIDLSDQALKIIDNAGIKYEYA
jgi:hypothetical protein